MHAITGPGLIVGGHWPYVDCIVLDSDIAPSRSVAGTVQMQVRVTEHGNLFIRHPLDANGPFVDCLSLLKALRMALPDTFAEVSQGRTPAYETFARELASAFANATTLDSDDV